MNTLEAIAKRRSIRKFLDREIERDTLEKILKAGIMAPSAKNSQPWKFVVVDHNKKPEMIKTIKTGFENEKAGKGFLKDNDAIGFFIPSAEHTLKIMEEAPVTIFIINTNDVFENNPSIDKKFGEMANVQSIGAAIENMILAALDYGIGSLWICDIFFAYRELSEWLHTDNEIIAALSLGYPNEDPPPRPRKEMSAVVEWK
jgi:nitroreductase